MYGAPEEPTICPADLFSMTTQTTCSHAGAVEATPHGREEVGVGPLGPGAGAGVGVGAGEGLAGAAGCCCAGADAGVAALAGAGVAATGALSGWSASRAPLAPASRLASTTFSRPAAPSDS